jgi:hypothetical protein
VKYVKVITSLYVVLLLRTECSGRACFARIAIDYNEYIAAQ